jgi:hypothetical protein
VVQKVECLLCKSEALSLNPSPTKKEKEEKKKRVTTPKFGEDMEQMEISYIFMGV